MKRAFADTSFYIALLNPDDAAHEVAMEQVSMGLEITTSAWVLSEVGNFLSQPENRQLFVQLLETLCSDPTVTIVEAEQHHFDLAADLFAHRPDKAWSFTDCTSFVIMQQRKIKEALTGDHHFEQAGFDALLLPKK